ncbi:MAG: hypothetical protein V3V28_02720 [Polaribacter sp.]|uniref:hypothetical protein n=1 Tax=Polaribacter sp. TaxID=1920175 RepID=UPI002F351BC5
MYNLKILIIGLFLSTVNLYCQNNNPFLTKVLLDKGIEKPFNEIISAQLPALIMYYNFECGPCEKILDDEFKFYLEKNRINIFYIPIKDNGKNIKYYYEQLKTQNSHIIIDKNLLVFNHISPKGIFPLILSVNSKGEPKAFFSKELIDMKKNNTLFKTLSDLQIKMSEEEKHIKIVKESLKNKIQLNVEFFDIKSTNKFADLAFDSSVKSIGLRYELIIPNTISFNSFHFTQDTTFNDFVFKEIPIETLDIDNEKYKKRNLRSIYVKNGTLIPKRQGALKIKSKIIKLKIGIPMNKKDPFGNQIYKEATIQIESKSSVLQWN